MVETMYKNEDEDISQNIKIYNHNNYWSKKKKKNHNMDYFFLEVIFQMSFQTKQNLMRSPEISMNFLKIFWILSFT